MDIFRCQKSDGANKILRKKVDGCGVGITDCRIESKTKQMPLESLTLLSSYLITVSNVCKLCILASISN